MKEPDGSRLRDPRVALAILGVAFLATAGLIGLFESTETRYAEIAREMLASGDWLAPRLNGILHLHKPPLAYWAAACGMAVFGANSWGARIPVALASIVSLACVARIATRTLAAWAAPAGRAVWVMGSMVLFAALGRSLASDPFLTTAVLLYWALAPSPWALAALGLGFLAKGPVVFLHTALPVLVAALWGRDRRTLALLGPARGWWLFALVGLPWYLVLAAKLPGLLSYLLGNQLWGRYATTVHQRGGPPWYFVAVALAGAAPWTVALCLGLARAWRERRTPEARLLLAWCFAPIAFLSFSGSKLPAYILPSTAAFALLAARELDARAARWGAAAILVALAVAATLAAAGALGPRVAVPATLPVVAAIVLLFLAAAAAWWRAEAAALLFALAFALPYLGAESFESRFGSPRQVARLLSGLRAPGEPVFEVGDFNAGLPFYLRERVGLIEVPRETQFDERGGAPRMELPRDSLAARTVPHGRAWLFGRPDLSEEIARQQGLSYVRIARWRDEALGFVTAAR